MRLIIRERDSMISDMNVSGGVIVIGSHPSCDIHLPDGRLGPRQVILEPEGEYGWTIRPLDERLMTTINGAKLHSRSRLKNGDTIGFADYSVRVYLNEPSRTTEPEIQSVKRSDKTMVPTKWPMPQDTAVLRSSDAVAVDGWALPVVGQVNQIVYGAQNSAEVVEGVARHVLGAFKADRVWGCLATDPDHEPHVTFALDASGRAYKGPEKTGMLIYRCVQRQQALLLPSDATRYGSALAAPLAAGPTSLGLIYMDRLPGKPFFTKADLAAMRMIGSNAGIRLDELLHGQQQVLRKQAQQYVEWSRQVQERLTPPSMPAWDNLEVAAYRQAGQSCSGDIYDVVRLPKGTAAVLLGHAMAAGVESAVLMAEVRAAYRIALLHADAPHFVLKELNWLVHDPAAQHSVRCFAGLLDPASGKLRYSTAGQPGVYLIRGNGEAEDLVRTKSPQIGEQPQMEYPLEEAEVGPGESVLLFTSGLITAANASGEAFGVERALANLEDVPNGSAHLILQAVVDDLAGHLGGQAPGEDVTVLILRRMP